MASVVFYEQIIKNSAGDPDTWSLIVGLAVVSGVFLSQGLHGCGVWQQFRLGTRSFLGTLIAVLVFGVIFFFETTWSTIQLGRASRQPEVFADLSGHCGVYSGRGWQRFWNEVWNRNFRGGMEGFLGANRCRIEHYQLLKAKSQLNCNGIQDSSQCLDFYMQVFGRRGHWNSITRQFFFDEARAGAISENRADTERLWIQYFIRDRELELARPGITQQARVEDDFSESAEYYKAKEELENLRLTKRMVEKIDALIKSDEKTPEVLKYRDLRREWLHQFERLGELEDQVRILRAKLSYNPSL